MADILKPQKCMCGNKVIPRYTGVAWQIKCDNCGRSVGAWGCAEAINARSWDIRKQSRIPLLLLTLLQMLGLIGSERRRPTMKRLLNLLQEGLDWILLFLLLFLLRLGGENPDDLEGL